MARKIAVVNQKGGVGKTTTAVNLATALTMQKKRVLLCDFDPQANATTGMGINKRNVDTNIYNVVVGDKTPKEGIISTNYGDVLPSHKDLAGASIEMYGIGNAAYLLKETLDAVEDQYDFILIDCPPSLEMLTVNALSAADAILVPVQCEYYALEGLSDLMNSVKMVKRKLNPNLEIEGVLLTMYDGRTNLSNHVMAEVKKYFPKQVYATVIPRNIRLSEAPSHSEPIQVYDPNSRGAEAYGALAVEVIKMEQDRG